MIRLSVPFRQAVSRLTFPVMLMLSFGIVLIGRADQGMSGALRTGLDDVLAPVYGVFAGPIEAAESGTGAIGHLFSLSAENAQLRAENAKLLQWQAVAMALEAQNNALKATLNYTPPAAPAFSTGDVVADLGGVYDRSVLVVLPPGGSSVPLMGAVAMDGRGVAGRVVEAGSRSARVLLITDINSRIPVALGASGAPALMAGTNGPTPALLYWAPGQPPAEGAMVLTSAVGGAFPPGLPVGVVHYDAQNQPVVLPLADLDSLRLLRLFSYPDNLPVLTPIPHTKAKPAAIVHHRKK
ncbi:rod shape-determining protein MreC [Acidocella sp.]|uniref:rod shape-determining protein MreC n=1 Tax=Acidocella sp. TaxID=50710 RepID=UPI00178E8675|nr:rod shape-determining protein MreC [Acidocella sp.]NNM57379.1 rod shape-determining protein MreC [Acidocella sp.]